MEQTKSKSTFFIVFGVVIVLVILGIYYGTKSPSGDEITRVGQQNSTSSTNPQAEFSGITKGDEKKAPTTPVAVLKSDKSKTEIRSYEVKIEKGVFTPQELVIEAGGRVQVGMVAVDADYDVSFATPLGTYLKIKKGEAGVFGFDATKDKIGVYTFACKDFCPQGGNMEGTLIVK